MTPNDPRAIGRRISGCVPWCALLWAALLLASAPVALAAPPPNDNFANAQDLGNQESASVAATNVEATKEAGEPNHAGDPGGASVWYRWTALRSGWVTVDLCGSDFDTLLGIYTGSAVNALTEVTANDNSFPCGDQSWVRFQATGGTTYRIAVDGDGGATGLIQLNAGMAPRNDDIAAAVNLGDPFDASASGTNRHATKQVGEPNHAGDGGGASAWYRWTPSSTGEAVIDTCDSDFDTLLGVYTGSGSPPAMGSLVQTASNDDACGSRSVVRFAATMGVTYWIAVDGKAIGGFFPAEGAIELRVRQPPANDPFASAQDLGSGTTASAVGRNIGATKEGVEPRHADDFGGASVWYRWTAPSAAKVTFDTCGSDFDTLLAVYTGPALDALTEVASNKDSCGTRSRVTFAPVAGTTYWIAVDGKLGASGPAQGMVQLELRPPPVNDDFANAQDLGNGRAASALGTNVAASKEAGEPNLAGEPGTASVWYRWTAPENGQVTIDFCWNRTNTECEGLLAVYTGPSLIGLTEVASKRSCGITCGEPARVTFATTADTTYWIAVDRADGEAGPFRLDLGLPPSNDGFSSALDLGGGVSASATGTTVGATRETGEPDHAGNVGAASVWYQWTSPGSGQVTIDICDSDFDTLLGVYTGSAVDALTPTASNDDACGNRSRVSFTAVEGTAYRIAVDARRPHELIPPDTGTVELRLAYEQPATSPPAGSAPGTGAGSPIASGGEGVNLACEAAKRKLRKAKKQAKKSAAKRTKKKLLKAKKEKRKACA